MTKLLLLNNIKKALKNGCKTYEWRKNSNGEKEYQKTFFCEDIERLKQTDNNAKDFFTEFEKYINFVTDQDYGIRQWANNIKHQGGFVSSDILKHDKVAFVECLQDDLLTFTTEWLYSHTPYFDDIITRLEKQKNNLTYFMDWLGDSILGNTQIIDFKSKPKLFSAGRCTQDIKSSIIISLT